MLVFALHANPVSARVFECEILDAVQVGPTGTLDRTEYSRVLVDRLGSFAFDENTGSYSVGGNSLTFNVLQRGTTINAMKALRVVSGGVSTVVQRLQINTFSGGEFVFVGANEIRSGVCRIITG